MGDEPSFNGGVWIADFAQWERENVDAQALFWVQANAARVSEGRPPFWDLATQPLLYGTWAACVGFNGLFHWQELWSFFGCSYLQQRSQA